MNGSDTESPFKFPLNILLLGERGVGKTSFLNAYLGYPVADDYIPTIGLDTTEKDHLLPGTGGLRFPLQFWDCGGEVLENKNFVNAALVADVIILMYDITNLGSFEKLKVYLRILSVFFGSKNDGIKDVRMPYLALVANKMDLEDKRSISQEEHFEFLNQYKFNSQLCISVQKYEWIRQWILTFIVDIAGIHIDKKYINRSFGPKQNQRAQISHLKSEMKAFKNAATEQENMCSIQ